MSVQARFYVSKVTKTPSDYVAVELLPVTRSVPKPPEGSAGYVGYNTDWSKYTPSGKLEMNVSIETGAAVWFENRIGKDVAITFEDVPE